MSAFDIKIQDNKICGIFDKRYKMPFDITDGNGKFGSLVYTLKTDDITAQKKPEFVPYNEHYALYDGNNNGVLTESNFGVELKISENEEEIILEQTCESDKLSSCGIFLPLNFMSQKNGEKESQFLVSSPYHTADKKHWLYYFTSPDGKNLAFITEGDVSAYKINYSPFLCGHFICGFSFLSSLDKAYGEEGRPHNIKVHILPVVSYKEALAKACKIWGIPALYYSKSSVKIGTEFKLELMGDADEIRILSPNGNEISIGCNLKFIPEEYGIYKAFPVKNGQKGADCDFFCFDNIADIYRRACDCLPEDKNDIIGTATDGSEIWRPPHIFYRGYEDHNLCEHAMWCSAILRYMRLFGVNEKYSDTVRNFLKIVIPEDDGFSLNACSLMADEGYKTKNSTRIQEAYNGISILIDAYKVFGDKKYLDFAVKALTARINSDIENGCIIRRGSDGATAEIADYTTVTCMVFPIVDMALLLKTKGDNRYKLFEETAVSVADFVVKRGMNFPTEGGENPEVNSEVEEGSMSCSALTVLYVAAHLIKKPEYLEFAKMALGFHDAFSCFTPHPVMFRSSLRWWETIWEGDSDGPAVCFGHAWSLWRAEAQFLYGILCFDDKRLLDSYNGFMGSYAKTDKEGNMYAIYQYEMISGGAVAESGMEMDYRNKEGFPDKKDVTLSRYLFVRDFECWQKTAAILQIDGDIYYLGCHLKDGKIVFDGISFETLYIGNISGEFIFEGENNPYIVSKKNFKFQKNENGFTLKI